MKYSKYAVLTAGLFGGIVMSHAAIPVVSNVQASQIADSKRVGITYDVNDADGDAMEVDVRISVKMGEELQYIAATNLTGDVGAGIMSGTGKEVVWDAGADWNGQFSDAIHVGISATDNGEEAAPYGMVRIPAGNNFGVNPDDDLGIYNLTVADDFFMGSTEVTWGTWLYVRAWAEKNGYEFANGTADTYNHPVHSVNWCDCVKWCNAKSEMEGLTPCYSIPSGVYRTGEEVAKPGCNHSVNGYRLPTVTEWEYAARGGLQNKRFPWGDTITHSNATYRGSSAYVEYGDLSPTYGAHPDHARAAPVGTFAPNGYGLYDVVGNLDEWTETLYEDNNKYERRLKGGSHSTFAYENIRLGYVAFKAQTFRYSNYGFRIVRR